MNSNRIQLLEQYAKEDPNDPFPVYALGLELVPENPARAKELFDRVMDRHPDYVPTYYHAALLAINQSESDRARSIITKGVEKAKTLKDFKAVAELEALLE